MREEKDIPNMVGKRFRLLSGEIVTIKHYDMTGVYVEFENADESKSYLAEEDGTYGFAQTWRYWEAID